MKERLALYARRIVINIIVLGILGSFAYLLVYLSNTFNDSESLRGQIAAPLAASGGTTVLPIIFFMLGAQEKWDRPFISVRCVLFSTRCCRHVVRGLLCTRRSSARFTSRAPLR